MMREITQTSSIKRMYSITILKPKRAFSDFHFHLIDRWDNSVEKKITLKI